MATVNNTWIGYLDRNFLSIKQRILTRMGETIPEMTDHSDSNIMVVAIEGFAGVAEQLSYYIDNMAREAFLTTARRYSSVVKHTRLIDYRIKAMVPATVDVTLTFENNDETPYPLPAPIIIPSGAIFTTDNGTEFISIETITVPTGTKSINLKTQQKTKVINDNLGITNNDPDQVFSLGKDYVNNSLELIIGPDAWLLKDTLGFSLPTDKHVIVDISAAKEAFIKFGDGINGAIPTTGLDVIGDYYTSLGSLGNIEAGTINTSSVDFVTQYGIPEVKFSNPYRAVGGTDYESIERIRRSAPLSIRTLQRAVTKQDYDDIALLCPGVDKAKHFFNCGKYVYIYVAPNGGGIANNTFLQSVEDWFDDKKMVTTFVRPRPAGESYLFFDIEATAKFRMDPIQLRADLVELLLDKYSYNNSDINKPTRVSDLIALVDNHPKVDYLHLRNIYLKPYIRPVGDVVNTIALNYSVTVNQGSVEVIDWIVNFDGLYMRIFRGNLFVKNLPIGETWTDTFNTITLTITAGAYIAGMQWKFTTLPIRQDLVINDYSIPVLIEENLTLVVNEQLTLLTQ